MFYRTFRQGCPAHINVLLSPDASTLNVVAVNCDHNHVISRELNETLPNQRRLEEKDQDKANKLMSLQVCEFKVIKTFA